VRIHRKRPARQLPYYSESTKCFRWVIEEPAVIARSRSLCNSITFACLLALLALDSFGRSRISQAAGHSPCLPAAWHIVETSNFRILSYGTQGVSRETANACEALREQLAILWLSGANRATGWMPKCDIVLHPSDDAYIREVGVGGRLTLGSSLIERRHGQIAIRRIDIKATQPSWQTGALGHELTHVILADRFSGQSLPRWLDEGIAIMADSAEKQAQHLLDLRNAMASRGEFRVVELIALADYPPARRWGAFYGQSTSLVQYLVEQGGAERFLEFVELSFEQGYEAALHHVYHFGVAELERGWQAHFRAYPGLATGGHFPGGTRSTLLPAAAAIPAQAVSLKKSAGAPSQVAR
jgi:hypothetical protein